MCCIITAYAKQIRETLSEIRQAKIKDNNISISISPNPAKNLVKIFISGAKTKSDISLFNAKGQHVKSWNQVNLTEAATNLDISNIAAGIYLLHITNEASSFVEKLIIN
jgi:hypothetical protein